MTERRKSRQKTRRLLIKPPGTCRRKGKAISRNIKPVEKLKERDLQTDARIVTNTDRYKIMSKIGSGGFGDVYRCKRQSDKAVIAVKVEFSQLVEERRLEKEYEVYRLFTALKSRKSDPAINRHLKHIMPALDFGECPGVAQFLFMPLCGPSLESLSKKGLLNNRKVLDVSIQTLEALECLHSYQYIHRDIKPGNFVYGLGDDEALIYIIDFGMTTKYCHTASRMPPTSIYDFIGTLRYASRTTHQGNAQTRRDDLESWLFVIMEIYDRSSLPWKKEQDKKIVLDMKEAFFSEDDVINNVFSKLPLSFKQNHAAIGDLGIFTTPNYQAMYNRMKVDLEKAKAEKEDSRRSLRFVVDDEED